MKRDNFKPTLRERMLTAAQLLDREADKLEGYARERDRLMAALQAGWGEVTRIRIRAAVAGMLDARRQAG